MPPHFVSDTAAARFPLALRPAPSLAPQLSTVPSAS